MKGDGPKIHITKPNTGTPVKSPVEVQIRFEAGKAPIDLSTLNVTLVKWLDIDITEHIKGYATPEGVHIQQANLPVGEHTVRITLADQEGCVTVTEVQVVVV